MSRERPRAQDYTKKVDKKKKGGSSVATKKKAEGGANAEVERCEARQAWQGSFTDRLMEALTQYIDQADLVDDAGEWLNVLDHLAQNQLRDEVQYENFLCKNEIMRIKDEMTT